MKSGSTKKRGVVYARVNMCTRDILRSQILMCQEKMRNDSVEAVQSPLKDVASGKSLERARLAELMKLAKNGSVDYVYVYDLARLGRRTIEVLCLLQNLKESGVIVKTMDGECTFTDFAHAESVLSNMRFK